MSVLDKLKEAKEKIDKFQAKRQKERLEHMRKDTERMKQETEYLKTQKNYARTKAEIARYKAAERDARSQKWGEIANGLAGGEAFGMGSTGSRKKGKGGKKSSKSMSWNESWG